MSRFPDPPFEPGKEYLFWMAEPTNGWRRFVDDGLGTFAEGQVFETLEDLMESEKFDGFSDEELAMLSGVFRGHYTFVHDFTQASRDRIKEEIRKAYAERPGWLFGDATREIDGERWELEEEDAAVNFSKTADKLIGWMFDGEEEIERDFPDEYKDAEPKYIYLLAWTDLRPRQWVHQRVIEVLPSWAS